MNPSSPYSTDDIRELYPTKVAGEGHHEDVVSSIPKLREDLMRSERQENGRNEHLCKSRVLLDEKKLKECATSAWNRCDALKAELCDLEDGVKIYEAYKVEEREAVAEAKSLELEAHLVMYAADNIICMEELQKLSAIAYYKLRCARSIWLRLDDSLFTLRCLMHEYKQKQFKVDRAAAIALGIEKEIEDHRDGFPLPSVVRCGAIHVRSIKRSIY